MNGSYRHTWLFGLFLVLATVGVYSQVVTFEFIHFDDNQYVTDNLHIRGGLSLEGIRWALTTFYAANWHPLTWLSHMADISLFGLHPGAHHAINLVFHILNTLLLFHLFHRMTGDLWPSGMVAALFAVHPLHVESVAWISERKDVLSAFFWLLTMGAYIRYAGKPGMLRYLWVMILFALGLMAKPMTVTLPFVLLLMDYWPLGRIPALNLNALGRLREILYEKIPLILLSAISSAMTLAAQQEGGAVRSLDIYPMSLRISNAVVSYARYLVKMVWSSDLALMYPHPSQVSMGQTISALVLIGGISIVAIHTAKRYPFIIVGWLWYLGTLIPVIGLVQVGTQALADRYTYIPLIGPFIAAAWGGSMLIKRWRMPWKTVPLTAGIVMLLILPMLARVQVGYWSDSISLFERTLSLTENNYLIHNNMGTTLANQGRFDEAVAHYRRVLQIRPNYKKALNNIGFVFAHQGRWGKAIVYYRKALGVDPLYARAHTNLGHALVMQGYLQEGERHYRQALDSEPDNPEIHNKLGIVLTKQKNFREAAYHFIRAIQINPKDPMIHNNLGVALYESGNTREGIRLFQTAVELDPQYTDALRNLDRTMANRKGNIDETVRQR